MTSALRWAAMRAILMFHNHEGQSHKTVSTDHNFWRERKAETDSNRGPSAYQPNALPLGQTGSQVAPFLSSLINHKIFLSVDAKPKQKETGQKVGKRKHQRRERSALADWAFDGALAGWAFDVPWPAEPLMCPGWLSLRWWFWRPGSNLRAVCGMGLQNLMVAGRGIRNGVPEVQFFCCLR